MKQPIEMENDDELRPEYSEELIRSGIRGKYAELYRSGTNLALLEPDIAEAFPSDKDVNEALRMLMKVACASTEKRKGRTSRTKRRAA